MPKLNREWHDFFKFVTKVTKSGRASYFVSYMRESFKQMKLPKYCLPKVSNKDFQLSQEKVFLFWIPCFPYPCRGQATQLICEEVSQCFESLLCSLACPCHSLHLSVFLMLQDMHIISTDEKQVFAAVQEWNQNNTYSLYISDSPGVYFILSLENLRTSRGPAGNLLVDFYKVCIQGLLLFLHHYFPLQLQNSHGKHL